MDDRWSQDGLRILWMDEGEVLCWIGWCRGLGNGDHLATVLYEPNRLRLTVTTAWYQNYMCNMLGGFRAASRADGWFNREALRQAVGCAIAAYASLPEYAGGAPTDAEVEAALAACRLRHKAAEQHSCVTGWWKPAEDADD